MASYFWVGGTGTWDNAATTHWAASTGGSSGAGPPTSSDDVTFDSSSGMAAGVTITIAATAACHNLTVTGPTTANITFSQAGSFAPAGSVTLNGNSAINRLLWNSTVLGTQRTLTIATLTSLTNIDFADTNGAGAASPFSGTAIGDALGNANITTTTPVTRYAVGSGTAAWGSTNTWSATSGGSNGASVPLPQDTAVFDSGSTATSYTLSNFRLCKTLDASAVGFTKTLNASVASTIYGSLLLNSGITWTGATGITLAGRSSYTIDPQTRVFTGNIQIACPGGTYTLASNFSGTSLVQTALGAFNDGGFTVALSTQYKNDTASTANTLTASGVWTLSGTGTVWAVTNQSATWNVSGMTMLVSDTSSTAKTIQNTGGGYTFTGMTIQITGGGTGKVTLQATGGSTITIGVLSLGAPKTINITFTTTLSTGRLAARGSTGNTITIASTVGASQCTLNISGGVQGGDWLVLQDTKWTGSQFYAGPHSTNTSNNTSVIFTDPALTAADASTSSMAVTRTAESTALTVADTSASADTITTIGRGPRAIADTSASADTITSTVETQSRTRADTAAATDAVHSTESIVLAVPDASASADTAVANGRWPRSAADTSASVSTLASTVESHSRTRSESSATGDVLSTGISLSRTSAETSASTDSPFWAHTAQLTVSDASTAHDSSTRAVLSFFRTVQNRTAVLAQLGARTSQFGRFQLGVIIIATPDTVASSDTPNYIQALHRFATDSASTRDVIISPHPPKIRLPATARISDPARSTTIGRARAFTEAAIVENVEEVVLTGPSTETRITHRETGTTIEPGNILP